jgi:NAD(P)H dehydrogenase (quinone)
MMIVVTGGTGTIGRALIERVRGQDVLAVVRKPADLGVGHALGDFTQPETVTAHLSAGDRLFLNSMPFPGFAGSFTTVIDLAKAAGVAQIVTVSVRGAKPGNPLSSGMHGEVDEHLRASGVPYAILQPASFMQNLIRDLRGDRFYGSWGEARMNYIDARDVGDVAAALLTGPIGESQDYLLTGPQSFSHAEIAAVMTAVLGHEIRYVDLPVAEMSARLAAEGIPEPYATDLPTIQSTAPEPGWWDVNQTLQDVTGRPPRTLAQFLTDHANAFRREPPTGS